MKMVVEKLVKGKRAFEVVEEVENANDAINESNLKMFLLEQDNKVTDTKDVEYVGVYEVGQVNLLEDMTEVADVHSFYRKKLEELGFDPSTFEKKVEKKASKLS